MNRKALVIIFLSVLFSCQQSPSEMVLIPAGEFTLGVRINQTSPRFMSERTTSLNAQPQQKIYLDAFYLDLYEVTYENFMKFKPQAAYKILEPDEPIRGINWYEADAYCQWIGQRLPTEFEWEKAARSGDDRLFVWGKDLKNDWTNLGKTVQAVGSFAKDTSREGVHDLNGNVSEWTSSWYRPYPDATHQDENFGEKFKVTRGGAIQKREHGFMEEFVTLPYRNFAPASGRFWDTGFRCALSVAENSD